jgi:hypothetical protein
MPCQLNATAGRPVEANVQFRNATQRPERTCRRFIEEASMSLRYVAPLAMAAAAATIGLAPVAAAAPTGPIDQCTATGNSTVCQRPGHVGIVSSPPVVSGPLYPSLPYPLYGVLFDNGRLR